MRSTNSNRTGTNQVVNATVERPNEFPLNSSDDVAIASVELRNSCRMSTSSSGSHVVFAEATVPPAEASLRGISSVADDMVRVVHSRSHFPDNQQQQQRREEPQRPEYVSASVYKENKSTPLGITIISTTNRLTVCSLAYDGLLGDSPVCVGDVLVSINNTACKKMDERTAAQYLSSLVGTITLVFHNYGGNPNLVASMITKRDPSDLTGVSLAGGSNFSTTDVPVITKIHSHGLFATSLLNIGDRVITVNNTSCEYLDATKTADLIRKAEKTVTIVAKTLPTSAIVVATTSIPVLGRPKFVSATIFKPSIETSLGIGLTVINKNSKTLVAIASIQNDSIIEEYSPFQIGDIIVSINDVKLVGITHTMASQFLKSLTGIITIIAFNSGGDSTLVETTVVKLTRDQKLGVSLLTIPANPNNNDDDENKDNNNHIIVIKLSADSCFLSSLKIGDEILSINDVTCDTLNAKTAANIIRNAHRHVKILARKASSSSFHYSPDNNDGTLSSRTIIF